VRVYVIKPVSVDSIHNDIDAKKTNNMESKGCHRKRRKGETKQRQKTKTKTKKKQSQTDRLEQTPTLEQLSRRKGKKEIWNDGDGGD
jgi:hypothetical protein